MPEVRAPRAPRRAAAPRCAARRRRALRDRRRGPSRRHAQVQGLAPLHREARRSAGADRRDRRAGGDAGLDQGARRGVRRLRVRFHGRLDGIGGRGALRARRAGRHRAEAAVRLRHRLRRRPHAGRAAFAGADGQDHRRPHRPRGAQAAVHLGADGSDDGRRLRELRDDRRRGDRRTQGADRLCRSAGDRADRAAEAARGLPARRVPAGEGRHRHDRRSPAAARQAPRHPLPPARAARRQRGVTLLSDVVRTSTQVSGTPSRLAKVRELADCLGRLEPDEIRVALPYLSGEIRQGKLSLGYASLHSARAARALAPTLTLLEVDRAFDELKAIKGKGAAARREKRLAQLFERATAQEQDFLARLIDGARVQVHKSGDEVRVFTRNLNDVTAAVPEIVAAVREVAVRSLILDGEVIALRPDGRPHPFQVTMRRFGRKLDVAEVRGELPLSVFFFDCLLLDGEPLVDKGGIDRRKALEAAVAQKNLTVSIVTADKAQAAAFYADALARGHEGVMAKALDAPYEAGRRGAGWLKVKRAHTLDLVVLAAEWGHGRRRGWLSNLHLGARDPASGGFVMLGKTFKGLTDELLEWQTREILARETGRDDWTVRVRPELVVEIAFNDLQESPHYPGGLALRFARVKGYRPDKSAADADTIETVRRIYEESLS